MLGIGFHSGSGPEASSSTTLYTLISGFVICMQRNAQRIAKSCQTHICGVVAASCWQRFYHHPLVHALPVCVRLQCT